jgi:spore maturation protein CgeB
LKNIEKVLITSDFRNPWNSGYYIKSGLEKNNIKVSIFDAMTATNPYQNFLEAVSASEPDILLYIKGYGLKPEWLREVKKEGIKLVQWYPDPVMRDWLPPFVEVADIFFTMSEGLVEEFRKINPVVFWLTQAFDPSFFQISHVTEDDVKTFSAEVTFVGNLGSRPHYLVRRGYLQRVIKEGYQFKWWGPRLSIKLSTIPLIFGKLGRSYGGRFVWGEEYAKVARFSKVFLAFDAKPEIRKSMSARMYTAVGCGAFYLCKYVEGIEEVLEPGREIVTFHDEDEMIEKIKYYCGRDDERKKIAEAGQKRVLNEHTYEIRTKQMLDIIQKVIS